MTRSLQKFAVAGVTFVIAGTCAWWGVDAWRASRASTDTVILVDNTEEMQELLSERSSDKAQPQGTQPQAAQASEAWPPPLIREEIDEELASTKFYKSLQESKRYRYVPKAYLWQRPHSFFRKFPEHPDGGWTTRVNQLGFRKDQEVLETPPDLRIVVSGDSHTAGLVANFESFPNVLEELLREKRTGRSVEVLNAGLGAVGPYAYLGVLEYVKDELPFDVFVATVYGGNDFLGIVYLQRYFEHRSAPKFQPYGADLLKQLREAGFKSAVAQEIAQVTYFLNNPDEVDVSLATAASITLEMQRTCEEAGIDLVCVYLPPAMRAQPALHAAALEASLEVVGLEAEDLEVSDRLGDRWLAFLEERGIPHLDLRPVYAGNEERLYWETDHHINALGHRLIAEALVPVIEALED